MNLKCRFGFHDWPEWFDTHARASAWRYTRQCRLCGRWSCREWLGGSS